MLVGTIIIFVLGYISIALEQKIKIDKAATALVTGVACWMMYFLSSSSVIASENELMIQVGNISGLLFFLLGAMTIVELVDSHQGFNLITDAIHTPSKSKLLIIVAVTSFFLSSVLDNLTTAIVMASLCKKIIHDRKDRLWFLSMVIIAVNAGGAWSPLGDVTTTLLWIGGQITPVHIIGNTLIPCIAVTLFPLLILVRKFHGQKITVSRRERGMHSKEGKIILFTGIGLLLFVPVFKNLTHLPPWMGMLFALGMSWIVSNVIHYNKNPEIRSKFSVSEAIRKIDTSSILFFLGILLSISSLQTFGILTKLAGFTFASIHSPYLTGTILGLFSAVIDNVPLIAAAQNMFPLQMYPCDHVFWAFLSLSAGTGGSTLIIGSAAGVALMGIEQIDFLWYAKKVSWLALLGFFAGLTVYILQQWVLNTR